MGRVAHHSEKVAMVKTRTEGSLMKSGVVREVESDLEQWGGSALWWKTVVLFPRRKGCAHLGAWETDITGPAKKAALGGETGQILGVRIGQG